MTPADVLGNPGFDHPNFHRTGSSPTTRKWAHIVSAKRLHDEKSGDGFLSDTSDYPSNLRVIESADGRPVPVQILGHPNDPPNDVHAFGDPSFGNSTKTNQGCLAEFTSRSGAKVAQALHAQKVQEATEGETHGGCAAPPLSEIAAHRYGTNEIHKFVGVAFCDGWQDVGGGQALVLFEQEAKRFFCLRSRRSPFAEGMRKPGQYRPMRTSASVDDVAVRAFKNGGCLVGWIPCAQRGQPYRSCRLVGSRQFTVTFHEHPPDDED